MDEKFELVSKYSPTGDQPEAIEKLVEGLNDGLRYQTLLGVTGSGKTFTMANIIKNTNRPTLVIAHNKTLAAQLCNEFREFFPNNRVEYFVSYYDYYQPEAYIASSDTYIEKDSSVNEEIDKLRHSAIKGIQRDDIEIYINDKEVSKFGSQGQKRTALLTLKLANFELLKDQKEETPILLLDDIMSELDSKRINFLLKYIENYQSVITTTEDTFVNDINNIKIYKVSNGTLEN